MAIGAGGLLLYVLGWTSAAGADEFRIFVARAQMAFSLAWHVVVACLGVGFPLLIVIAEAIHLRTGDPAARRLARRWSRVLAVLFAVGAVSGTILSFELGMLWPGLMAGFGEVIGLPFALEGIAFFVEAIFVGIHLYGWDRLPPRIHFLSGIPIVVAGVASAWFVVTANAWMNQPVGFTRVDGRITEVDPWGAMLNPATPVQTTHMILAAFMVAGFLVAGAHARELRRGRGDQARHRLAFRIALAVAAAATPVQIAVGDWAARFVSETQPAKLAAMEGVMKTQRGAPLHVGGWPVDGEIRGSIEIPNGLSMLVKGDPEAEVAGLDAFPPEDRPPVAITHAAFQAMLLAGGALLVFAAWAAFFLFRRGGGGVPSRRFLGAAILAGPAAVLALEAGWVVTEVGRQPWIVQGVLRTRDAATAADGIGFGFLVVIAIYAGLTGAVVHVLDVLARRPEGEART